MFTSRQITRDRHRNVAYFAFLLVSNVTGRAWAEPPAPASVLAGAGGGIENPQSGLTTFEVKKGPRPMVLLHGYGSEATAWLPFAETIQLPKGAQFIFPQGPEATVPPDGPPDGRAWWRLDLASYIKEPGTLPDLSHARPAGLEPAALKVRALIAEVRPRLGLGNTPVILGGFSQGAMVASEITFRTLEPVRALVLLSGTPVDEASWLGGMKKRHGLPVFISHGRRDDVLPFAAAMRMQAEMKRAGLKVTWYPFDGGHEIPAEVVIALNKFLARQRK